VALTSVKVPALRVAVAVVESAKAIPEPLSAITSSSKELKQKPMTRRLSMNMSNSLFDCDTCTSGRIMTNRQSKLNF
jgi:hypothetical protein